jgi:hypothetical protein
MKPILMFTLFTVLTLHGTLPGRAGEPAKPALDKAAREQIIAGANEAMHKHLTGGQNTGDAQLIGKEIWGEAITALKPLRVVNDQVNVFIVLKADATMEEGLYVSIPYSSHAARMDKRFLTFDKLSEPDDQAFGTLFWCKLPKVPSDGATNAAPAQR